MQKVPPCPRRFLLWGKQLPTFPLACGSMKEETVLSCTYLWWEGGFRPALYVSRDPRWSSSEPGFPWGGGELDVVLWHASRMRIFHETAKTKVKSLKEWGREGWCSSSLGSEGKPSALILTSLTHCGSPSSSKACAPITSSPWY